MPDLKSVNDAYLILCFIVPGVLIVVARAQFITGRLSSHKEALLTYFTISAIYLALALPAITFAITLQTGYQKAASWFSILIIGPICIGVMLGLSAYHGLGRKLFSRVGLKTVHPMPTAWDYKFALNESCWVLVTLTDGTTYAGLISSRSFASTDQSERDLYIERLYNVGDDNKWTEAGNKGLLILAGQIRTVEFWPYRETDG